jgi:hypothetical protein
MAPKDIQKPKIGQKQPKSSEPRSRLSSCYGVAQNGNLGQNNNSNQPWPMSAANDYVRAIDFTQPASRATWQT